MLTLDIPGMQKLIKHVALDMREPVMLWGSPGVGKSEGVRQACKEANGHLVDIRLSQYDSVDLRGIPVADMDTRMTVWNAPATLPFKGNPNFAGMDDRPIFLFLDEITSAAPAVAAVAYQLVNDRAVGEHELMDNVVVVAASNRDGDGGVTNRMPTPLANRFTHAEVDVDVDAWCHWAQLNDLHPMGIAFVQFRKDMLNMFKRETAIRDKAFATPRTWEKALRYYASSMPEETKRAAMQGAIGAVAIEFWGFVDVCKDLPSLDAIRKDPHAVDVPDEAAVRYATAVAVSGAMTKDDVSAFHTYLTRMDPEFMVLAWSLAIRRETARFEGMAPITQTSEFVKLAKDYREVLVG